MENQRREDTPEIENMETTWSTIHPFWQSQRRHSVKKQRQSRNNGMIFGIGIPLKPGDYKKSIKFNDKKLRIFQKEILRIMFGSAQYPNSGFQDLYQKPDIYGQRFKRLTNYAGLLLERDHAESVFLCYVIN